MGILLYQLFIIATLLVTRVVAPKKLAAACCVWTVLTIINVFMPALVVVQLLVIWITFSVLQHKDEPAKAAPSRATPSAEVTATAQRSEEPGETSRSHQSSPRRTIDLGLSPEVIDLIRRQATTVPTDAASAPNVTTGVRPMPFPGSATLLAPAALPPPLPPVATPPASSSDRTAITPSHVPSGKPKTLQEIFGSLLDGAATTDPTRHTVATDFLDEDAIEIRDEVRALRIPFLVHFTRVSNLASILEHGICSITMAAERQIEPHINDTQRLDGRLDAISLSVAFPNFRMFYQCRAENPSEHWVVLKIDPAVLWRKDCAFCERNAADHRVRDRPIAELKGMNALRGMFRNRSDLASRYDQHLLSFDPSDSQAEVLVLDNIEPDYILEVAFDDAEIQRRHAHLLGAIAHSVQPAGTMFFGSRSRARRTVH